MLKVPKIKWIPFDKENPPDNLYYQTKYLVLLRDDNFDNGKYWLYSVDVAEPYGSYIDDFWDTENDWCEGQCIEVVAYAELPHYLFESKLVEVNDD